MIKIHKSFSWFCYAAIAIVITLLFFENFIFSSKLGYLILRDYDDLAFQVSLRQTHINILRGNISSLFALNDYAYGWVFWITMSMVTFPSFLLSYLGNIDWPLIVIPRQISLIFTILCLLVLRKILKRFTVPEWGIAGALLMLILLPAIGYFSMRFSTVNAVMFFAMLSLYLAMRDDHPLDFGRLLRVFFSLAIAGAIKLTGLLIAPLVFSLFISD